MDYLKEQPSSLGKVGDLPENIQRAIAKSFTPQEKKKIMDEADKKKEEKNGRKV